MSITTTWSSGGLDSVEWFEISGTATACFDQQNSGTIASTGTAGAVNNTASITTTHANELLVAYIIPDNSGTITPQSPWATLTQAGSPAPTE